jgi:hypothetical protein
LRAGTWEGGRAQHQALREKKLGGEHDHGNTKITPEL